MAKNLISAVLMVVSSLVTLNSIKVSNVSHIGSNGSQEFAQIKCESPTQSHPQFGNSIAGIGAA